MDIDVDVRGTKSEGHQRGGVTRRDILRLGATAAAASLVSLSGVGLARATSAFRVVETQYGKLRGRVSDGLATFLGVRYGADTGGVNRFMPPQPVTPWTGVRDALARGNQCAQLNPDLPTWVDPSPATEDCLMLNVFCPASATATSRLPVMVWLHGGGYAFGSSYSHGYNCGNIARGGNVITVGVDHRLNGFGYTYLGEQDGPFAASGNAGHLDIIQALQWVRDNIEKFGGDPSNVTVFGQSGGGAKITALCTMPAARGLFHKAIIQSGSVLRVRQPHEASILTDAVYDKLQLKRGDIKALQAVPTTMLLKCFDKAAQETNTHYTPYLAFSPTVDGRVIPEATWRDKAPDLARDIPFLMGMNSQEAASFLGFDMYAPLKEDVAMVNACIKAQLLYNYSANDLLPIVKKYREMMPNLSDAEMAVRISTDISFWKGAMTQSNQLIARRGAPVYMYECAWKTPCFRGEWALHGVELPFIFDVKKYGTAWDGQDSDALRAAADPSNKRAVVGSQMFEAWVSFARNGNPSTKELPWPAYDAASRTTMLFDADTKLVNNPHSDVRDMVLSL